MTNEMNSLERHWRKGTRELCKTIKNIDYQTGMVDVYYAVGVVDVTNLIERAYNICSNLTDSLPLAKSSLDYINYLESSFDDEDNEDVVQLWNELLADSDDIGGHVPA